MPDLKVLDGKIWLHGEAIAQILPGVNETFLRDDIEGVVYRPSPRRVARRRGGKAAPDTKTLLADSQKLTDKPE